MATSSTTARTEPEHQEPIEVRTRDGHALRADVRDPHRKKPVGVAVLAHAMFARRSEFERPEGSGLSRFLCQRGWRTIAFDFRGHGDSQTRASDGGSWTYDDLVFYDLPAVVECARARARGVPVIVVGHSLGGHVALASQGAHALEADGILAIAANVWMRSLEPSRAHWAIKRGMLHLVDAVTAKRGYFPARALRLGSDDEASGYMRALVRFAREEAFATQDGKSDYAAGLRHVTVPVFSISSRGDWLNCRPVCAERMLRALGGPKSFMTVEKSDDGSAPPGHMALVTTERALSAWAQGIAWLERMLPGHPRR
jgi:predicted alpha/beta hydrolase